MMGWTSGTKSRPGTTKSVLGMKAEDTLSSTQKSAGTSKVFFFLGRTSVYADAPAPYAACVLATYVNRSPATRLIRCASSSAGRGTPGS